jgi:hypothetical protein
MPSTTAGGLPYPLPTEQARDGATAIQNLANALEARGGGLLVQAGSAVVSLNASGDGNFTYGLPFKAGTKPSVLLQLSDPLGSVWISPNYQAATNTLCPFRMSQQQGANPPVSPGPGPWRVNWIAVGAAP